MTKHYYLTISFLIFFLTLSGQSFAHSNKLTPPNHPRNASFYVCYLRVIPIKQKSWPTYYRYKYQGCFIDYLPCRMAKGREYRKFGWFNNYHNALNSFYQCAYS